MLVQVEDVKFSISHITTHSHLLFKEILKPIGCKRSMIYLVMTGKGEDTWPTFDRYFDTLFAEAQQTCANITKGQLS